MRARPSSVVIALLASACDCAAESAGTSAGAAGGEVRLQAGQSTTMESPAMKLTFEGVESDSRCPKGEACIWEGDAVLRLTVTSATAAQAFELHTSPRQGPDAAGYDGWSIRLVALEPLPVTGRAIAREAYVATLHVERGTAQSNIQ
ncbi:MAG: hypothetical protein ACREVI_16695 [Steroidobacteraceae bacterium]